MADDQALTELLDDRQNAISEKQTTLSAGARRAETAQSLLGYATIVIAALLGGSLGSTLVADVGWLAEPTWRLVGALLGVVAAVASGIQTRGNLNEQALTKRVLAARYDDLHRTIERYKALYSTDRRSVDPPNVFLDWIDQRLTNLALEELGSDERVAGARSSRT